MPEKNKQNTLQDLKVSVYRVQGCCPVFTTGDDFLLKEGYRLISQKPVCMHSLAALLPFYNALRFVPAERLGLAGKNGDRRAFLQCPDPCAITGGGTVTFAVEPVNPVAG